MYGAMLKAIETLKSFAQAKEPSVDLVDEPAWALEEILRAASARNAYVAEEYDRYLESLEGET